jgi:hypothetical protein
MILKPGTRIEVKRFAPQGRPSEPATIGRWNQRINGPRMDGWHLVRFESDGARLIIHEERFSLEPA